MHEHKQALSVSIVGAGIAGLAAATVLAQKGHHVTVLEASPSLNEFGASIDIMANGVRCLRAWGITEAFEKIVTKNGSMDIRDGHTNKTLGYIPRNRNKHSTIDYGDETWNINRKDYQETLAKAAEAHGAKILFNAKATDIDLENAMITTAQGDKITADVIVGADGMKSAVRHAIPVLSGQEPQPLYEQCFRCTVPKDKMRENALLESLLHSGDEMCWTGPGRYVLGWPLPPNRSYDIVTCVRRASDVPAGRWGIKADPDEARRDFQEFCPQVTQLLGLIDHCVKWTLAELPPLPTCRSESGKVVLIGDAFHAMIPHSASGGNSAIEDAACIAECLDWAASNHRAVSVATKAFEDVRKARVERMQTASQEGYGFLGADGEFRVARDAMLAEASRQYDGEFAIPEAERRVKPKPPKDMHARFPSPPYMQWLHGHDTIQTTKAHLATLL